MLLTDTHTHLYASEFDADRDGLVREAIRNGVQRFFLPNIDSSSVDALLSLEKKYPDHCFAMMGLHPCSVKENWEEEMAAVEKQFATRPFAAVGEIGMDLYWDKTFVREQEEVFRRQLRLSAARGLPVVIHSRESFEEIYAILLDENERLSGNGMTARADSAGKPETLRGIFHCFTGTADQAARAVALGFYLGIGGVVTFKNSGLDRVVAGIALEHLVLETDAPYLAPAPFRGKRNLPEYLVRIAEKVAEVQNVPVEDVARVTTENSRKIFGV